MPNQRDVARIAGVSSASVSRYLTSPHCVRPKTAQRIEHAIQETGYTLDHSARSLRTGRSYHVGILMPGIGPFYWEIHQGIQDALIKAGYFNTIFYTRDTGGFHQIPPAELLAKLSHKMMEGVIFFPMDTKGDEVILREIQRLHQNIVLVDRDMDNPTLDQVFIDNHRAGRLAAQAFLDHGHRQLLFLDGMKTSYAAVQRREGFLQYLAKKHIDFPPSRILPGDYSALTAYKTAKKNIPTLPPFTGVFAVNDATAMGFLRAAGEEGLQCPHDFSLIGFDNNEEFTPFLTPSLSTFQQPLKDVGTIAAEHLLKQMDGLSPPKITILQPQFIPRESLSTRLT
ncbi:MAG: LacI family transcriptional regulator [Spirochaetales bacterium]|nr:LacI family transcriptional regulator [Spirochaetales bacterium]